MNHRLTTTPPLTLAGRNKTFPIGPGQGIKDLWQVFMTDFGKIAGQVGFNAYGVCHNFDGKGHMDYLCAVEVKDGGQVPGYMHVLQIPARKTAVFTHKGPIEKIHETWNAIFTEHLPAAKLEVAPGPQFEVYGEAFNAGREEIEIFIPVK
ncbi:GyrI-like domain-containing protein [Aestuariivirga litoralis]|uniref:GyrI-like domain-containing protein n=1 Tax=Aestuariivirga litoralis TaxID=2650924 RepID=UPI0018C52B6F|nr:GyrI-like domain-containing protein [Aestuariivirga litoralis]MBG1233695.1 AraC family transcriptional regulator [Aestuariivirga litoralis]